MSEEFNTVINEFTKLSVQLANFTNDTFSGVGLVLYNDVNKISPYHCNLIDDIQDIPLVKLGNQDLINYLYEITDYRHPYHDGFHFINSKGILTHVAQFFSPPVNKNIRNVNGQGARTYCAQSGSSIDGIMMISSISSKKYVHLFEKGQLSYFTNQ